MTDLQTEVRTWQFFLNEVTQEKLTNYNVVALAGELFDAAGEDIHLIVLAAFDIWWVMGDCIRAKELITYAKSWQIRPHQFKEVKDEMLYYLLCNGISEAELQGFIKLFYNSSKKDKLIKILEPSQFLMFIYPPKNLKL